MNEKIIAAAEFKATCLRLIDEMNSDGQPITITKRGKPVAKLVPASDAVKIEPLWGYMKGTVLHYEDPFAPAIDPDEWEANK
ncbi:type II toxin-antitoxin system Phd/YefM family antitoxin [Neorhizobium lilium]|uniref:Antitoxin n=1 Tax=Neorhizobium lilium TaxID=2503024 RepID=A0A444LI73_9HYPH|nr:type II toxin-antitoxin system Phd/YefM family antitoxin [Neorhizobium lilium]RWX78750.1 type II toxin-antitoxin system Phd/YefM family antitoxin [Neorhizobium lilium]